jgi:O-antigen ligase
MIILMGILVYQFSIEYAFVNRLRLSNVLQMNVAYFVLLIIPWIFLIEKRVLRIVLFFIILIPILFSVKRTAVIALSAGIVFGYGTELITKRDKGRIKKLFIILIVIVLAFFVFETINELTVGRLYSRFESIPEDRGTRRLKIYADVFHLLVNSSYIEWLIGHGHNTVKDYMFRGFSAHNDWLEVLFDYGLIGFCLYCLFHLLLIMKCINLTKESSIYASVFASSYIIFLIMSMTSHLIIYPYVFVIMTILWGSILGLTSESIQPQ